MAFILHRNCLLKHVIEGRIEEMGRRRRRRRRRRIGGGGDASSYWMILRKRKDTVNWQRKHYFALCGELALKRLWTYRKTDHWMNGLLIWSYSWKWVVTYTAEPSATVRLNICARRGFFNLQQTVCYFINGIHCRISQFISRPGKAVRESDDVHDVVACEMLFVSQQSQI